MTTTATKNTTSPRAEGLAAQLAYLTRVLRVPTVADCWEQLAAQAREANWSHEEYLAALLARQVADREAAGNTMRIRTAHFPAVKTLEEFNLDHLPSLRRDVLAHLATGTFVTKAENVILLGPPGIGKTHLAIGLGIKAAQTGHSVLFDTASNWINRLAAAHHAGALEVELKKIRRYRLIIIDEVGYIPFDQDAANLFFQLIASRYEQASVMVTSNLPFGRWSETFSDDVVAAAMIDRLVHHAEVLTLSGDSYRTRARRELLAKDRDRDGPRNHPRGQDPRDPWGVSFRGPLTLTAISVEQVTGHAQALVDLHGLRGLPLAAMRAHAIAVHDALTLVAGDRSLTLAVVRGRTPHPLS